MDKREYFRLVVKDGRGHKVRIENGHKYIHKDIEFIIYRPRDEKIWDVVEATTGLYLIPYSTTMKAAKVQAISMIDSKYAEINQQIKRMYIRFKKTIEGET